MLPVLPGMWLVLLIGIGIGLATPGCGEGNDDAVSTPEQTKSARTTAVEPPGGKYNGGQTDPIFYFYFQSESAARKAGTTLREKGYKTRVTAPQRPNPGMERRRRGNAEHTRRLDC